MKNIFFSLFLFTVICSCNKREDLKNIESFSRVLLSSLESWDTAKIRQLYFNQMDHSFLSPEEIKKIIKKGLIKDGLINSKFNILGVDTLSGMFSPKLHVFFKANGSYYRLRTTYLRDSVGTISIEEPYIINLEKECKNDSMKNYQPYDLQFKFLQWTTDYYNNRKFKNVSVEISNETDRDINFIKFRLIIYSNKIEVFNQTIQKNINIYKGDRKRIEISELSDYTILSSIDQESITWTGKIISVLPRPQPNTCLDLLRAVDLEKQ